MMSLNVGLTSEEKFSCIVGFSGKIINQDNLKNRIKIKTVQSLQDVFESDKQSRLETSSIINNL